MRALLYKNKANKVFAFYFLSHRWKQIFRNQQENDRNPTQKLKPQKAIGLLVERTAALQEREVGQFKKSNLSSRWAGHMAVETHGPHRFHPLCGAE